MTSSVPVRVITVMTFERPDAARRARTVTGSHLVCVGRGFEAGGLRKILPPLCKVYESEPWQEDGFAEQEFAIQAPGVWHRSPLVDGEFVCIREIGVDEAFEARTGTVILRFNEIVPLPGEFAQETFVGSQGKVFDDAGMHLFDAAFELLLETLARDYEQRFGKAWPDQLVEAITGSLRNCDLTAVSRSQVLDLATEIRCAYFG